MRIILIIVAFGCGMAALAQAEPSVNPDSQTTAQSIIGALDYVAIDYPAAVKSGSVVNADEYTEQREFVATVKQLLTSLPARPQQHALLEQVLGLASLVDQRASGDQVATASRQIVAGLIEAYGVITAPRTAPDPLSVAALFTDQCSACHGKQGRGDGPAGMALDPHPTNFHDAERARERSLYGLYSTITLGVAGTSMLSFATLSEDQRWALAFYVAGLGDDAASITEGKRLWNAAASQALFPTLASFTDKSPATMLANPAVSGAMLAYLRHHPEALARSGVDPIQRTIDGLHDVVTAYKNGQADKAQQLALSAYLEGFELVEAPLGTIDNSLTLGIERDMQVLRNSIRDGVPPDELASSAAALQARLWEAASLLSANGSSNALLATSAFVILLREGLEAILLLAAMALYLRRTEHKAAMLYLHYGWLAALAVGAVTWIGIKTVISISGAQREVMEGISSLLAAFVLLYVGIWLHRHSTAVQWQAFLNERLGKSLSTETLWGIAALSFVAVYREILETVLFYETLWLQSGKAMPLVIGAAIAGIALLGVIWMVFQIGTRLPLRRFFQANGIFMFILAIIFAGKGVAALQEAGWIGVTFVRIPRIDWLGIYPTAQSVGTQLVIVCIGAAWLTFLSRRGNLRLPPPG